jgi:sugar O-acyltransferase (sialic acid O-acetyltransferase NeuD family)
MVRPLVICGTGGNALDILDIVSSLNTRSPCWSIAGFLDDAGPAGGEHMGFPMLGGLRDAGHLARTGGLLADAMFVAAIGSERNHHRRTEIISTTGLSGERFATLIHPQAGVSTRAELGFGCCVNFGASIAGRTKIGDHVWVGPCCVVGHDSVLETCVIMAPRSTISGGVRLEACSYIGSGAVIRQSVSVGKGALVGLGAVVLRDVAAGATVVGNPARVLDRMK